MLRDFLISVALGMGVAVIVIIGWALWAIWDALGADVPIGTILLGGLVGSLALFVLDRLSGWVTRRRR